MTTIGDIARAAGVSKTTVSRVMNGKFGQVTAETRERVETVIKNLDYTPNALARSLKSMKTDVIGIVLSDLQNPFWAAVLDGVERTCRSLGYRIMICNARKDGAIEEQHVKELRNRMVDGILINPTVHNQSLFASLLADRYPIVALNRKLQGVSVETVAVDNIKGAFLATEHLIRLGRKRIAILVYPPGGVSTRLERIEGYLKALRHYGLEADDGLIHIMPDSKDAAKQVTRRILADGGSRPDAILSTNNLMSLEILEAIKESQVRIPAELSFVGYDETPWSRLVDPPLTVVKQPAYEMGEAAANRLIRLIRARPKSPQAGMHLMEPSLVVRASCGAGLLPEIPK